MRKSAHHTWHSNRRADWDTIYEENDFIKTPEEVVSVKKKLRQGKQTCLVMRMEHLRAYKVVLL